MTIQTYSLITTAVAWILFNSLARPWFEGWLWGTALFNISKLVECAVLLGCMVTVMQLVGTHWVSRCLRGVAGFVLLGAGVDATRFLASNAVTLYSPIQPFQSTQETVLEFLAINSGPIVLTLLVVFLSLALLRLAMFVTVTLASLMTWRRVATPTPFANTRQFDALGRLNHHGWGTLAATTAGGAITGAALASIMDNDDLFHSPLSEPFDAAMHDVDTSFFESSNHCVAAFDDTTWINPSTGAPMIDGMGGVDVTGHVWSQSDDHYESTDPFDDAFSSMDSFTSDSFGHDF